MSLVVKARRLDIGTGGDTRVVVLRGRDAEAFGVLPGDRLQIRYRKHQIDVVADVTHHSIKHGEVGLFEDVWKVLRVQDGQPITIDVVSRRDSVNAIKKKLLGQTINDQEIFSIISDIVHRRLSAIEMTYFVASGYVKPYSIPELVGMVRAMASTGEMFHWGKRIVVDKHSVGGLAGNRTTMVAIPIVAAAGLTIPKTSSRAITSPSGTADTMEVLAPVSFAGRDVRRIVQRTGACLIWGGGLSIAPADDLIIRVSKPLSLEPYDKMIVSIMAKKVAMGVKVLVIDMPYGPLTKIPNRTTAQEIEKKFQAVARAFDMKIKVRFDPARQPIGQGIGPALEARDVVRVLQQHVNRPADLERKAVALAGELLELAGKTRDGRTLAQRLLTSGLAWKKMQAIISAQGGPSKIEPEHLLQGAKQWTLNAWRSGRITAVNNRVIDDVARTLGAPEYKLAGLYLHQKIGRTVRRGQPVVTLYSHSQDRLELARRAGSVRRLVTIG